MERRPGINAYEADASLRSLLGLYLGADLRHHLEPHLRRLGDLVGGRLDELAEMADKHPPILHPRSRYGNEEEWIEYHSSYREMEHIAFCELGLHAMSHRGGVLGWPEPLPAVAKYAFQYLFVQAEFGLMCPVSVTDTAVHLVSTFGSDRLKEQLLPRMLSQDPETIWKGAQFMTEKVGGSDVGSLQTVAKRDGDHWRLYGDKWFCSHADADIALVLARPEGAPRGSAGLGLFALPRALEDGSRNDYRIVRLKDKLGTRSMASGEIVLDGALAYQVGDLHRGLKQMLEQVNLSRLSHGVRAAAMMRRCFGEASQVARHRVAFGRHLIEMPIVQTQLLEMLLPAEQALSMWLYTADVLDRAKSGDAEASRLLRVLTPLIKLKACRDNIEVASAAMEMRGGNGYIEDWVNARLVRDAHIGVLWEGTSNIVALDLVTRAFAKDDGAAVLSTALSGILNETEAVPQSLKSGLHDAAERAIAYVSEAAANPEIEVQAQRAAGALYHATRAAVMALEGDRLARQNGGSTRLSLAELVLECRLSAQDPLASHGAPADKTRLSLLADSCNSL
jgi:acyl-CoA dehydrogenase